MNLDFIGEFLYHGAFDLEDLVAGSIQVHDDSAVADPGFRKGRFHSNTNAQPGLTCTITVHSNFHNASYITSYM